MSLFNFGVPDDRSMEAGRGLNDPHLEDQLSSLVAAHDPADVSATETEVQEAVVKAARSDLRAVKLLGQGRCPDCQNRTEYFLYTTVCPHCGWYRRTVPDTGHSVVHLDTGERIVCDRVYRVRGEELLCVKEGVVVNQVAQRFIRQIEHIWSKEELAEARRARKRRAEGICAWCERDFALITPEETRRDTAVDGVEPPFEEFVAFGAVQDRYMLCSRRCIEAFRKQFPSRIHRNCYETECRDCNACIKRYDITHFRRAIFDH